MSKALIAARKAAKEKREAGETLTRKSPWEKWLENPKSLRACVNAMCYQCMGGGHDPGTIGAIRNCTANKEAIVPCPLWQVRPYQEK